MSDLQEQNSQNNLLQRIQALEDFTKLHAHHGYDLSSKLINGEFSNARIINEAVLGDGKEHSGSLEFKIAPGKGDVQAFAGIAAGDFTNTGAASGFIFGIDDSDSDLVKFYWGNATRNVSFDGSSLLINGYALVENTAQFAGLGTDGDVTISGNTTLTSDKLYNNLTVNDAVRLNTAGYKVYVKDTLTMGGSTAFISNNGGNGGDGGNGSGATGGSAGTAGAAASGGTTAAGLLAGVIGKAGANGDTGDGQSGTTGDNGTNVTSALSNPDGVAGGTGGDGGDRSGGTPEGGTGGSPGTAGTSTLATRLPNTLAESSLLVDFSTVGTPALYKVTANGSGAGSGASGAGSGATQGGGGGGSGGGGGHGGVCFVFARTISGTGFIEANGGNGGTGGNGADGVDFPGNDGGGGGGGGGAPGGGGVVFCAYISKAAGVTVRANAGTVGSGGTKGNGGAANATNGTAGATGNAGTLYEFDLST